MIERNMSYKIYLPDKSSKEFLQPPKALDVAKDISPRLAKDSVGVLINGEKDIQDIRTLLKDGDSIEIITLSSNRSLEVIRHSAAHVMAQAVQRLWPDVKVTIGPVIEDGFYYDFDTERSFTPEDLKQVDQEMRRIVQEKPPVIKEVWPQEKALDFFEQKGELLKKEIIKDLNEKEVSVYRQGDWLDLCRGPHVQHLGQIGALKTLSLSGAYWRGDSSRKQLQRIYGTAFHKEKDLLEFLKRREERKKNDHRTLGKHLDLFWFHEFASGSPFFTEKGAFIYRTLQEFLREKYKEYGYGEVITPQFFLEDLFRQSGHIDHFKDSMYSILEKEKALYVKPMNCPGHCLLYKKTRKSYRDLPWRIADFGRLHRKEMGGALQGLTRVNSFSQDDAHIFCRLDQLDQEIKNSIQMLQEVYGVLGFDSYQIHLSTRPESSMGDQEVWNRAESTLKRVLEGLKIDFQINKGDGAFYGPKLDILIEDSFHRSWQLGTFQCDFNLPKVFDLSYVNEAGEVEVPVMIHRAIFGSLERFIGVYLEHCRGRLPLWLSPQPAVVLPLTDKQAEFSLKVQKTLEQEGIICQIDLRNEKLSYKIRQAQLSQIPYMIVIGKKEVDLGLISVRFRDGTLVESISLDQFKNSIQKELRERSLTPQVPKL